MIDRTAATIHAKNIVIDAVCPLIMDNSRYTALYSEGGATAIGATIGGWESARPTLDRVASWHRLFRERNDLVLVRKRHDIEEAKRSGRLGIFLHIQGADPIEDNLDLVDLYKSLGVGIIQLTYNVRNRVGDGCEERGDAGLSRFGVKLIERLNQARVIVDCSHTGERTSMEAIACSRAPVVLSHSNAKSLHDTARNVSDQLIDAIARSGGVIGVAGFPAFVSASSHPSLDEYIAHIDVLKERVGIDHVALGIDYYWGQAGIAKDEDAWKLYEEGVRTGRWGNAYPPPPHWYPAGIETPKTLPRLTERLLERGYNEDAIRKVLGGNWLRVMDAVWGK